MLRVLALEKSRDDTMGVRNEAQHVKNPQNIIVKAPAACDFFDLNHSNYTGLGGVLSSFIDDKVNAPGLANPL